MFHRLRYLLAACCCAGLLGAATGSPPPALAAGASPQTATLTGLVTWIYDADTFDIAPHGKVRLLGIDAPEKTRSDRDRNFTKLGIAQKRLRPVHGAGLAWCLHNVKDRRVTLTFDKTRRDRHGRLLAYVHLADGRLLNRVLLEEGLVIVYRRFPIALRQDFLAAEATAKARRVGLWTR
jgi:micrococcal nuclease